MNTFPYSKNFRNWLLTETSLSKNTINRTIESANHFWNYYFSNSTVDPLVKNINANDIREYLSYLQNIKEQKATTINKHLSYLRKYFDYLYDHNLISKYPLLKIKGISLNRQRIYKINWMSQIDKIAYIPNIHFETIIVLNCISLGMMPEQILKIRYNDLIEQINNTYLKNYIEERTNFNFFKNPYLLQTKKGEHYANEFNIQQKIMSDRKILGMSLRFEELRRSYIYSIIQEQHSDKYLKEHLNLSEKSLLNYKKNLIYFVKVEQFELNKSSK